MAKVSTSAVEARELGLLRAQDRVVFHAHALLHVARQQSRALAERGYRPPLPARRIRVAGDAGIATFRTMLLNILEARFISQYDHEHSTRLTTVLCDREHDRSAVVPEGWSLRPARTPFVDPPP